MDESIENTPPSLESRLKKRRAHLFSIVERYKFRTKHGIIAAFIGFSIGVALWILSYLTPNTKQTPHEDFFWLSIALSFAFLMTYVSSINFIRGLASIQLKAIDHDLASAGIEQLQQELEDDFFTKLVKINFKYIDQYYLQTQSQADKSFKLCLLVALAGFFLVGTGVSLILRGQLEPAYLVASSGVITEFIAAIFFYLYNKTILKMAEYHRKLVLTQNISVALKIAEALPESDRTRVQEQLVMRLSENVNQLLVQESSEIRGR